MDKKVMGKIEDGFCDVLKELAETGLRSSQDVETAKAALSGLVKMKMLEEMENYSGGMSGRAYYDDGGMSSRGSYRRDSRGRNQNNGQYMSRDGGMNATAQSGHSIMQHFKEMLEDMAQNGGREGQEAEDMLRFMR